MWASYRAVRLRRVRRRRRRSVGGLGRLPHARGASALVLGHARVASLAHSAPLAAGGALGWHGRGGGCHGTADGGHTLLQVLPAGRSSHGARLLAPTTRRRADAPEREPAPAANKAREPEACRALSKGVASTARHAQRRQHAAAHHKPLQQHNASHGAAHTPALVCTAARATAAQPLPLPACCRRPAAQPSSSQCVAGACHRNTRVVVTVQGVQGRWWVSQNRAGASAGWGRRNGAAKSLFVHKRGWLASHRPRRTGRGAA